MCFCWWTLQRFDRLKKDSMPNHRFTASLVYLFLNHPLDNANILRLRKLQRYNIYII